MALTTPIFNMFGKSPIRPLQKHMHKAVQAAEGLLPFCECAFQQNWQKAEGIQKTINKLEKDADNLKKDLRLSLPKGLFLPVPRTDILTILTLQDRIANKAQDIAGLIMNRKMVLPESIREDYKKLLNRSLDASRQAHKAINELDELLETGFSGNDVDMVEAMIVELNNIEHDTDEMQAALREAVFAIEDKHPPVNIMFLYKLIEWTGDLADCAQSVGGQFQLLLAK